MFTNSHKCPKTIRNVEFFLLQLLFVRKTEICNYVSCEVCGLSRMSKSTEYNYSNRCLWRVGERVSERSYSKRRSYHTIVSLNFNVHFQKRLTSRRLLHPFAFDGPECRSIAMHLNEPGTKSCAQVEHKQQK